MNYEQEAATKSLLKVHSAMDALRDATIQVKALHEGQLNTEQSVMISNLIRFVYADTLEAGVVKKTGDSTYWKFEKFLGLTIPK